MFFLLFMFCAALIVFEVLFRLDDRRQKAMRRRNGLKW